MKWAAKVGKFWCPLPGTCKITNDRGPNGTIAGRHGLNRRRPTSLFSASFSCKPDYSAHPLPPNARTLNAAQGGTRVDLAPAAATYTANSTLHTAPIPTTLLDLRAYSFHVLLVDYNLLPSFQNGDGHVLPRFCGSTLSLDLGLCFMTFKIPHMRELDARYPWRHHTLSKIERSGKTASS